MLGFRYSAVPVVLLLLPAAPLTGQRIDSLKVQGGALYQRLQSATAVDQQYALYLPTEYRTDRHWPVLILMDPRGRALVPLQLVQSAAERYGYIVLSSYNTRSDEMDDPNAAAVNAMLADAQQQLAIDTHRLYLVGFSGTARAAWEYGYRLEGNVAGLLGFGAGFTSGWAPPAPFAVGAEAPLVYFGGAGTLDFNYEEIVDLDAFLDSAGVRHQVEYYPGPHGWPPKSVMDDGLTWMELQAMRRGLTESNEAWIDSLYQARLAAAAAADQPLDAYRLYRAVANDFKGLRDVTGAGQRAARLEAGKQVQRVLARQQEIQQRYKDYFAALRRVVAELQRPATMPELSHLLKELSIRKLQREAANQSDSLGALAAQRLLEQDFTWASFYWPRNMAAGDPAKILVLLDLAEIIHPGRQGVCESRREALRKLGRADSAGAGACSGRTGP